MRRDNEKHKKKDFTDKIDEQLVFQCEDQDMRKWIDMKRNWINRENINLTVQL